MTKTTYLIAAALLALAPAMAQAMPAAGDILGTDADTVKAAMEAAGCPVAKFEVEDGMVEAVCTETATGTTYEIVIDPKTGVVAEIKQGD